MHYVIYWSSFSNVFLGFSVLFINEQNVLVLKVFIIHITSKPFLLRNFSYKIFFFWQDNYLRMQNKLISIELISIGSRAEVFSWWIMILNIYYLIYYSKETQEVHLKKRNYQKRKRENIGNFTQAIDLNAT